MFVITEACFSLEYLLQDITFFIIVREWQRRQTPATNGAVRLSSSQHLQKPPMRSTRTLITRNVLLGDRREMDQRREEPQHHSVLWCCVLFACWVDIIYISCRLLLSVEYHQMNSPIWWYLACVCKCDVPPQKVTEPLCTAFTVLMLMIKHSTLYSHKVIILFCCP